MMGRRPEICTFALVLVSFHLGEVEVDVDLIGDALLDEMVRGMQLPANRPVHRAVNILLDLGAVEWLLRLDFDVLRQSIARYVGKRANPKREDVDRPGDEQRRQTNGKRQKSLAQ